LSEDVLLASSQTASGATLGTKVPKSAPGVGPSLDRRQHLLLEIRRVLPCVFGQSSAPSCAHRPHESIAPGREPGALLCPVPMPRLGSPLTKKRTSPLSGRVVEVGQEPWA